MSSPVRSSSTHQDPPKEKIFSICAKNVMEASVRPEPRFIAIAGPSGCGKTTVITELIRQNPKMFTQAISHTTRSPRPGERDGVDYHFVTPQRFHGMVGSGLFMEHADYCGNHYGTTWKSIHDSIQAGLYPIKAVDVQGCSSIATSMPEAVRIFLMPSDPTQVETRLRGRSSDSPEDIAKRIDRSLSEIQQISDFHYLVTNDDGKVQDAVDHIVAIMKAESCRVK